jgi:malonyl-CoA O-methyltransferase
MTDLVNRNMNNSLIRRKFGKSIATYDHNAYAQKEIAGKLAALVLNLYPHTPSGILEIGCGTGLLTKEIIPLFADAQYYMNDINEKVELLMPALFPKNNYVFVAGDAQLIDFPCEIDLLLSSSTVQWFDNLHTFGQKAYQSLSNEGYMFLSTFGGNNLKEIREITGTGLEYLSLEHLQDLFSRDFEILHLSEEEIPVTFNSVTEIFSHLRSTGVNANASGIVKTRSGLKSFCDKYTKLFSDGRNVRLTYNPIYLALKKRR